jgi:hypothetical protein
LTWQSSFDPHVCNHRSTSSSECSWFEFMLHPIAS